MQTEEATAGRGETGAPVEGQAAHAARHHWEVRREGATMGLYVSVVLLAELAALPEEHLPHGFALVALIWGTCAGLAIAHWFSFTVASKALGAGGALTRRDVEMGLIQIAAAAVVALASTLPLLLLPVSSERRVTIFVPAVLIGLAGWFIGRSSGHSVGRSLAWAAGILAAGLAVAAIKATLGH